MLVYLYIYIYRCPPQILHTDGLCIKNRLNCWIIRSYNLLIPTPLRYNIRTNTKSMRTALLALEMTAVQTAIAHQIIYRILYIDVWHKLREENRQRIGVRISDKWSSWTEWENSFVKTVWPRYGGHRISQN